MNTTLEIVVACMHACMHTLDAYTRNIRIHCGSSWPMRGGSCMHTLSKLLRQNIMHACMHACICIYKKHRDLQIQPVDGLGTGFASLELGVTSAFFTLMHAVINEKFTDPCGSDRRNGPDSLYEDRLLVRWSRPPRCGLRGALQRREADAQLSVQTVQQSVLEDFPKDNRQLPY